MENLQLIFYNIWDVNVKQKLQLQGVHATSSGPWIPSLRK